jgi:hypothetical protein
MVRSWERDDVFASTLHQMVDRHTAFQQLLRWDKGGQLGSTQPTRHPDEQFCITNSSRHRTLYSSAGSFSNCSAAWAWNTLSKPGASSVGTPYLEPSHPNVRQATDKPSTAGVPCFRCSRVHVIDGRKVVVFCVPSKRSEQHAIIQPRHCDTRKLL